MKYLFPLLLLTLSAMCLPPASALATPAAEYPHTEHPRLRFWEKIALKTVEKRLRKVCAAAPRPTWAQGDSAHPCGYIVLYPGERVEAHLVEISSTTVIYRMCGAKSDTLIRRSKEEIIAVVAANGDELYSHLEGRFAYPVAAVHNRRGRIDTSEASHVDGLAIVSLILSLIPFTLIAPVLAILTGAISLGRIKRNSRLKGRGIATLGIVLGLFFLIIFLLFL